MHRFGRPFTKSGITFTLYSDTKVKQYLFCIYHTLLAFILCRWNEVVMLLLAIYENQKQHVADDILFFTVFYKTPSSILIYSCYFKCKICLKCSWNITMALRKNDRLCVQSFSLKTKGKLLFTDKNFTHINDICRRQLQLSL